MNIKLKIYIFALSRFQLNAKKLSILNFMEQIFVYFELLNKLHLFNI